MNSLLCLLLLLGRKRRSPLAVALRELGGIHRTALAACTTALAEQRIDAAVQLAGLNTLARIRVELGGTRARVLSEVAVPGSSA